MKIRIHYPVFLALIAAFFITACDVGGSASSERVDPEQLIPASANFIAQVRVADILRDVDFESLYRQTPKDANDPKTSRRCWTRPWARSASTFASSTPPSFSVTYLSGRSPSPLSSKADSIRLD